MGPPRPTRADLFCSALARVEHMVIGLEAGELQPLSDEDLHRISREVNVVARSYAREFLQQRQPREAKAVMWCDTSWFNELNFANDRARKKRLCPKCQGTKTIEKYGDRKIESVPCPECCKDVDAQR
jgi:hypothetical protein